MDHSFDIETILAAERPRLVHLCARLSGSWDAAEDLAQETLLQAWNHLDRLYGSDQVASWLTGIARNVCLHWSRSHYREQARLVQLAYEDSSGVPCTVDQRDNDFDLDFDLEREELITLLDRALTLLPAETRQALVYKYVEDSPYTEIAAHLGINENAVAARVHRGKLAFRRILTNELRAEAVAYGLVDSQSHIWEETRIWCPQCGRHRLCGRFTKETPLQVFELKCPVCDKGEVGTHADLSVPYFAQILGSVKTYKPAFMRLITTAVKYCKHALSTQNSSCLSCGSETFSWLGPRDGMNPDDSDGYEVRVRCVSCPLELNSSLGSLTMSLPEVQQFWRAHPKLCTLPTRMIDSNDTPALMTRLRSLTDTSGLDIIAARDTFEIIGVYAACDH